MTTVVFGGSGFVGLNIVEAALSRGDGVTVFDRTAMPAPAAEAFAKLPGRLEVVEGDVTDPQDVARAFAHGADTVVYGAAVTGGLARDREAPEATLGVNLTGFLHALRAARDAGAGRIVNLSSAGAFGDAAFRHDVLTEETPADPVSLYSMTKFSSERMAARMADVWGIDALSVRLSGVFGRWERKTSVRDTPSPQHQLLAAARDNRPARIPRRDNRDWIYAPDVARAVLALLDAPQLNHRLY
ncbi:MAG: NAD(P)-dependent oxidoreductase, partial [Pseudomonadota bacterium]